MRHNELPYGEETDRIAAKFMYVSEDDPSPQYTRNNSSVMHLITDMALRGSIHIEAIKSGNSRGYKCEWHGESRAWKSGKKIQFVCEGEAWRSEFKSDETGQKTLRLAIVRCFLHIDNGSSEE